MKKLKFLVLFTLLFAIFTFAACSARDVSDSATSYTPNANRDENVGCCDRIILIQETALLGENTVTKRCNYFIMTLNSDRAVYSTTDAINIWGTLEYIGDRNSVTVSHPCPLLIFSISDGQGFHIGGAIDDISASSVLQRGRVYHFGHQKSGSWIADADDAEFWQSFFREPNLFLHAGELTITLYNEFSFYDSSLRRTRSDLIAHLTFVVTP